MLQTTFNSQTVFVVNDAWDAGVSSVSCDFSLILDQQESLTKREARRAYSSTLRVKMKYDATVQGAALAQLQSVLRALNTQQVVIPFWPAQGFWGDRASAPIKGGLMIAFKEDWSQFEIYESGTEPVWPGALDLVAPALLGFIAPTEPSMLSPGAVRWTVDFTESSPAAYALAPTAYVWTAGPQPAGYSAAPYLLPLQPDFTSVSEQISVDVARENIGFTRDLNQTFYTHAAARSQSAGYTLSSDQPAQILRFFLDAAGLGASFWSSSWIALARVTQDIASSDTVIHVEDSSAVAVGDYISWYNAGTAVAARKVTAKTSNTVTLDAAVGSGLSAESTCLFQLCLARLNKPLLSIAWSDPGIATATLKWTELPAEYVVASDETLGSTIGQLRWRVILFDFSRDLGNGTVLTNRFTNFEKDIVYSGNTYSSRNISHGDIRQTLNLESGGVDLTSFNFSGNPLALDIALKAETALSLTIRHADYDGTNLSNVNVVFTGQLDEVRRTGQKLSAKFNFGPASLDDQLPRMIRGRMCNHIAGPNSDGSFLISYGCTLLKADWNFTATVANPVSGAYPYILNLTGLARVSGPAPTYFTDWFAFGWIEVGTGSAIQRRMIIKSTNPSGGALAVTLQRALETLPAPADTVHLFPGCDGMYATCKPYNGSTNTKGKFANDLNFGSEPFCPAGNPMLTRLATNPPRGAKK